MEPEARLYQPALAFLHGTFRAWQTPRHARVFRLFGAITATGGQGSGKWTRPDLAAFTIWQPQYSLQLRTTLITVEVKTARNLDVTAVYEALSHRQFAHEAYVLAHAPEPTAKAIDDVRTAAHRHGVGLILCGDPLQEPSYQLVSPARRYEPSPDLVDEFIAYRFEASLRDDINTVLENVGS